MFSRWIFLETFFKGCLLRKNIKKIIISIQYWKEIYCRFARLIKARQAQNEVLNSYLCPNIYFASYNLSYHIHPHSPEVVVRFAGHSDLNWNRSKFGNWLWHSVQIPHVGPWTTSVWIWSNLFLPVRAWNDFPGTRQWVSCMGRLLTSNNIVLNATL